MSSLKIKLILIAILVIAYSVITRAKPTAITNNNSNKKADITVTVLPKKDNLVRTYYGILPCNDCEGRETTLIFTQKEGAESGTYQMIYKRLGLGNASVKFSGNWIIKKGLPGDPNAKIIVTDPDEDTEWGYFIVDENQIEELDDEGYRDKSPAKYRLKLQN